MNHIYQCLVEQRDVSAIIYCFTINDCTEMNKFLERREIKTNIYHGKLDTSKREVVQNLWKEDKLQVICSTLAFWDGCEQTKRTFDFPLWDAKVN